MRIAFTKMHGNGNDFVLIDEFNGVVVREEDKPRFVRAVCHRKFGVGADGALFVQPSDKADVKFRYFNSDGGEAEMCGNGIRCFSRYVVEEGYAGERLKVETLAGILELEVTRNEDGWWVKVDMGRPKFRKEEIPATVDVWGYEFEHEGRKFKIYAANTGVPHVVAFVDDLDFDIIPIARKIRYAEIFPEGTNVNFAKVEGDTIRIRTYERGVEDETLSCGTGSVAVAAIANKLGLVGNTVKVVTKGGLLKIDLTESTAYMTGGANRVFDGILRLNELKYEV
ncbi:diaminopimelate epimerase [Archaeoglobus sp.]